MPIGAKGLLALALLAAACGSPVGPLTADAPASPTAAAQIAPGSASAGGPEPRSTLPALSVTTIDGRAVAVPDGSTPTVVYFMATWCLPCLRGARELDALHQDYADSVRVVAIDLDPADQPADLAAFRDRYLPRSRFLWAMDEGERATRAYGIRSLDATILLGPRGEILFRSESYPDFAALRRAVQRAVER